jgi:hypothetical protein
VGRDLDNACVGSSSASSATRETLCSEPNPASFHRAPRGALFHGLERPSPEMAMGSGRGLNPRRSVRPMRSTRASLLRGKGSEVATTGLGLGCPVVATVATPMVATQTVAPVSFRYGCILPAWSFDGCFSPPPHRHRRGGHVGPAAGPDAPAPGTCGEPVRACGCSSHRGLPECRWCWRPVCPAWPKG